MHNRVFAPPEPPATLPTDPVQFRWLLKQDMPTVLAIERASFEFPWSEEDFRLAMHPQNNTTALVAECGMTIVGYVLYCLERDCLTLLTIAVAPSHRRRGVGAGLLQRVARAMTPVRNRIVADVRDNNLAAHQFLRSLGMVATEVLHDQYVESDDDIYRFVFPVREGSQ